MHEKFFREIIFGNIVGRFCKIAKEVISHVCSSVRLCPYVRTKQLGTHWLAFYEILFLRLFRKFVEKVNFY